ncbi:hypothetical protein TNCV_579031 [Trichonephila clavipes]|nr:hypothetical protein TNCV_579031 [Trichonephila clavipes]
MLIRPIFSQHGNNMTTLSIEGFREDQTAGFQWHQDSNLRLDRNNAGHKFAIMTMAIADTSTMNALGSFTINVVV